MWPRWPTCSASISRWSTFEGVQGSGVRRFPGRVRSRTHANPDILCNSEIKFRCFLDHAMQLGADKIATGHYAQVREWSNDGRIDFQLMKAEDGTKDQSYFLYRLNQAQLAKTLFPLGKLYKREVRKIAAAAGLHIHDKKDSTGICFIGERPFRRISDALPADPARRDPKPRRRQGAG